MAKTLSIICPLYNAETYLPAFHEALNSQKNVHIAEVKYVLTKSTDNTKKILDSLKANYEEIESKNFSHSLTREKAALAAKGDIIVFLTQDVEIADQLFLHNLTAPIIDETAAATYARQISKYNNIEKYTREKNYPAKSFTVSKDDIPHLGLKTFFFSDAACAFDAKIFKKLKGYDGKNLPFSEDMYFAYKLIMNNYKIHYCASAKVYHSHQLTVKQLYNRYKLTGKFMKQNPEIAQYGLAHSGASLAKYVLKRILQDHQIKLLIRYPFDMSARYLGMKVGEKSK